METKKTIYEKLAEVKKEIGKISKDSENPFFKSKYFDINALLQHTEPLLQKNGLLLLQPIENGCVNSIIIDIESGEKIESELKLAEISDPQKIGSAITYYRRYTLQSLLSLQAEDDDGNKASGKQTPAKPQTEKTPEKWLNETDKDGNETKEWANVIQGIYNGKITSIADVRKVYAVAKLTSQKLEVIMQMKNENKPI